MSTDNIGVNAQEIDSFVIASGRRTVKLFRRHHPHKPWIIAVYMRRTDFSGSSDIQETLLSTSEYADEDVAKYDFETRRPKMRDAQHEVHEMPMQKGKRLVQEVFKEQLK